MKKLMEKIIYLMMEECNIVHTTSCLMEPPPSNLGDMIDAGATCKKIVNLGATHNVQTNLSNEMTSYILERNEFPN